MNTADLHIHTTFSDGRLNPLEIVDQAKAAGLRYIAITDHDTVDGYIMLRSAGYLANCDDNITIIPGIEFSTDMFYSEVHILGYFIDVDNNELRAQLSAIAEDRVLRMQRMISKLVKLGFHIEYERVMEIAGQATSLGRPHIAQALVEKKYFSDISAVFEALLRKNGPAYVPHYKLLPKTVIDLIHHAGGIAILAHPGLIGDDQIIFDIINAGIDGLEVYHPKHDNKMLQKYLVLAERYQLKITGGSDFHAITGRFPERLGVFTIPGNLVNSLKTESI
ncbi:MAG TPA: PHP domain-containing protein [Methylomusa anaerophila]|uniref:Polymerase/histidinol phosphatase N-terminal domain-containing protein n=1 Tax=Methylomusa anaerophila TaxID=1930071 RepID=A0A348APV4_9FIRM|nr:PHP domain-containing protein [Methylomusa anaerophila]BBB93102.1 hypothetical protein MAMMFC1_03811 [Methylomusa anaerophila]HML87065.1 PHP domain-containing protein [Methylomusa anaerophila]